LRDNYFKMNIKIDLKMDNRLFGIIIAILIIIVLFFVNYGHPIIEVNHYHNASLIDRPFPTSWIDRTDEICYNQHDMELYWQEFEIIK